MRGGDLIFVSWAFASASVFPVRKYRIHPILVWDRNRWQHLRM